MHGMSRFGTSQPSSRYSRQLKQSVYETLTNQGVSMGQRTQKVTCSSVVLQERLYPPVIKDGNDLFVVVDDAAIESPS